MSRDVTSFDALQLASTAVSLGGPLWRGDYSNVTSLQYSDLRVYPSRMPLADCCKRSPKRGAEGGGRISELNVSGGEGRVSV